MAEIMITKLLPPRIENNTIKRPRLLEVLKQMETSRVILLTAPAGYGKTVLITQYLSQSEQPFIWYHLDSYDNDPIIFLNYLLTAIRQRYPDFARRTLHQNTLKEAAANPRMAATVLINNLAVAASQGLSFVFDDYHVIQEPTIHHLIEELCLHLPDAIRIILISRINPPFNLSRLEISGHLSMIGVDILRFNHAEMDCFLKQKGVHISGKDIADLGERISGWPAALRLLNGSIVGVLAGTEIETSELFSYLASEVFERQPDEIQGFLCATSVLDVMDTEICNQLLERDDSERLFLILEKQQLFLTPLSGEKRAYRYHQLFRDFLLERLGKHRAEFQRRAGRLFQNTGEIEQAVEYMITAGIDHETLTVLKQAGLQALRQGHWLTVERWLTRISDESIFSDPWISLLRAQVLTYRGLLDEAEFFAAHAEKAFNTAGEEPGIGESQILRARIFRCGGNYQQGIALLEEAIAHLPPVDVKKRFDIPMERAFCLFFSGRLEEAAVILRKALDDAKHQDDPYMIINLIEGLGNIYYLQGKHPQAMQGFQLCLRVSPEQFLPDYYMQNSIAHIYSDWGQLDQALEFSKRDLNFKESLGITEALPSSFNQLAHIYIEQGELDLAYENLNRGIEVARRNHGDRYFYILNRAFLGWVYAMQSHWVKAKSLAEEALLDAKAQSGLIYPVVEMIFGTILAQTEETEKARVLLEESVKLLTEMGAGVPLCNAYKALAWLYDRTGNVKEFRQYARNYLELAAKIKYIRNYLSTTYHLLRPILKFGLTEGIELSFVQRVLVELGEKGLDLFKELAVESEGTIRNRMIQPLMEIGGENAEAIIEMLNATADLKGIKKIQPEIMSTEALNSIPIYLQTFGTLRVFIYGKEIDATNWRTIKSRDLLAYLAHQGQPVGTDKILEDLWPNHNPEKTSAIIHTTFYYLRQTLNQFFKESLVIYGVKQYQLRPGSVDSDRRQFEEKVRRAMREPITDSIINQLEQVVALYKGDYLADLDYFWIIPLQEELKSLYLEARQRLACYYLKKQQYSQAIIHLQRLMVINPFSEETLNQLMTALAGMGDVRGIAEYYSAFTKTISEELGLQPSPQITASYKNLCRQ